MAPGAGKCPEWQRELTVNQPPHGFEGSSPSFPTTLRPDGLRVAQPRMTVRAKRVRRSWSEAEARTDCREHAITFSKKERGGMAPAASRCLAGPRRRKRPDAELQESSAGDSSEVTALEIR